MVDVETGGRLMCFRDNPGDNGQIDDTRRTAQNEARLNRNDDGEKFNLAKRGARASIILGHLITRLNRHPDSTEDQVNCLYPGGPSTIY